jgi:molybdenum cofactor biosynthesis enzyme MoaA
MPVDAFSMIAEKLGFLLTDRCNYMCIFRMPNNPEFISLRGLRAGVIIRRGR